MNLYKFSALNDFLGVENVELDNNIALVEKPIDITERIMKGEIAFQGNYAEIEIDGLKVRGYVYLSDYYIDDYAELPKFHTSECHTIKNFIKEGKFEERYMFSSVKNVNVKDIPSGKVHKNLNLNICGNCKNHLTDFRNTEEFYEYIKTTFPKRETTLDIFGYPLNWEKTAKKYKKSKDYNCEQCGIDLDSNTGKRFLEVHHIDGNKTNNHDSNLKALCISCHSQVNERHRENFRTERNQQKLREFEIFKEIHQNS